MADSSPTLSSVPKSESIPPPNQDEPIVKFRKPNPSPMVNSIRSSKLVSSSSPDTNSNYRKSFQSTDFHQGSPRFQPVGIVRLSRAQSKKLDERLRMVKMESKISLTKENYLGCQNDALLRKPSQSKQNSSEIAFRQNIQPRKSLARVRELNRKRKNCWMTLKAVDERFGLKHFVLTLILVAYAFLGAFAFYMLEWPHEVKMVEKEKQIGLMRRDKILESIIEIYDANCSITKRISNGESKPLVDPQNDGTGPSLLSGDNQTSVQILNDTCQQALRLLIERYEMELGVYDQKPKYEWDFWNSMFFACTVFTTIGYGHMACRTFWGRFVTIIYALFGIPLMLTFLNGLGDVMFKKARVFWNKFRLYSRRFYRTLRVERKEGASVKRSLFRATSAISTNSLDEPYENFPLPLAIGLVFIYIMGCAALFKLWETNWDYWTAIYFFFVSLTTVGFGDIVPEHPRFTILGFTFFIIGLALVSMCINVIQAKVEKGYKMYFDWDDIHQLLVNNDQSRPVSLLIATPSNPDIPFNVNHHKLSMVKELTEDSEDCGSRHEKRSAIGVLQIVRYPQPHSNEECEDYTSEENEQCHREIIDQQSFRNYETDYASAGPTRPRPATLKLDSESSSPRRVRTDQRVSFSPT